MESLKITLLQPDIIWENPSANFEKYFHMLEPVVSTDLIILPEMFSTGFSMNAEKLSETMEGSSVQWMKKLAKDKNASVVGSLIIRDGDQIFNRAVWVFPDEKITYYNKRHLFTIGEENNHYSAGTQKVIVDFKGWQFCILVCYDLRFPVWSRNTENYDVVIYVANWPASRANVWKSLLVARALENQSYCVGVNRVGTDGLGIHYQGDSMLVSPKGWAESLEKTESVRTFDISYSKLHDFRKHFPVLDDKDSFQLSV